MTVNFEFGRKKNVCMLKLIEFYFNENTFSQKEE